MSSSRSRPAKTSASAAPQEAVTPAKQHKLRLLADYYLQRQRLGEDVPMRFDVVAITLAEDGPRLEIIQNAF